MAKVRVISRSKTGKLSGYGNTPMGRREKWLFTQKTNGVPNYKLGKKARTAALTNKVNFKKTTGKKK